MPTSFLERSIEGEGDKDRLWKNKITTAYQISLDYLSDRKSQQADKDLQNRIQAIGVRIAAEE